MLVKGLSNRIHSNKIRGLILKASNKVWFNHGKEPHKEVKAWLLLLVLNEIKIAKVAKLTKGLNMTKC